IPMRILAAIVLLLVLIGAAFYLGSHWNLWQSASVPVATTTPVTTGTDYYQNVATWQTYADATGGFSIAYPIDFNVTTAAKASSSTDWRLNAGNNPGLLLFTLMVPKAFEPQTNFSEAKLTV